MENEELKNQELENQELGAQELKDQDMEKVVGGASGVEHHNIYDRRGRIIGEATREGTWSIVYWRCRKCGRPMHLGTLNWYYCDPCDYKKYHVPYYIWPWGEEKLIEAAD